MLRMTSVLKGVSETVVPRALLCGFWGSPNTVAKVMRPYADFYRERGFAVDMERRTPYQSLLGGYRDRQNPSRKSYDVIHCMSGGSFTALNFVRGGMAVPRKVIFEGGPMLGSQQEAVNFLTSLHPTAPQSVKWGVVRGLLVPAMHIHHQRPYLVEQQAMLDALDKCPSVLVLNGTADTLIDRTLLAKAGSREILFEGATHNRILQSHADQWRDTVLGFIE
jgi:hypothetical protein